jgi:transglutaminase-like putative cysteine protease
LRGASPLLVAAALLLWGWQNAFLPWAAGMAAAIEAARWVRWRWPVTDREFNHVSDLSSVVLLVIVIYVFSTQGSKGIFLILALLPFTLFPLVLVQVFSERGRMKLSALFLSLRRLDPGTSPEALAEIDLTLPYLLLCLISASAGNRSPAVFFFLVAALLGIVLWSVRSRRHPAALWAGMLILAVALGWAGQIGLMRLQYAVEASVLQLFDRYLWRYRDPNMATTAIGMIGRIKLSDRIVLRVRTDEPLNSPLLLREATYDSYRYGVWSARRRNFTAIDPEISGTAWTLRANGASPRRATISTFMSEKSGVVPLPHGANRIDEVVATEISRNPYGTVSMEIREGWIHFTTAYDTRDVAPDSPPTEDDLRIGPSYVEDFERLARTLELPGRAPAGIVAAVRGFFADGFSYSLTLRQRYPRDRYLADFLFNSRTGHCEFFATSTVLLLRAAGVPARYAVGYAVDEYSPLEGQYIARARHAHSWALAWLDGRWHAIDTTPPVWAPLESEQASAFEPLFDLWAWISYRLSRWQSQDELEDESAPNLALLWLLIPLAGVLAWRLVRKERIARPSPRHGGAPDRVFPGMDSALYRLVRELERRGFARRTGETLAAWISRCMQAGRDSPAQEALRLHYRYRFDPRGLTVAQRESMDRAVERALDSLAAAGRAT